MHIFIACYFIFYVVFLMMFMRIKGTTLHPFKYSRETWHQLIQPNQSLLLYCSFLQHRPEQGAGQPGLHEAGSDRLRPQAPGGQHVWAGPRETGPDQSLPDPEQLQASGQVSVRAQAEQEGREARELVTSRRVTTAQTLFSFSLHLSLQSLFLLDINMFFPL